MASDGSDWDDEVKTTPSRKRAQRPPKRHIVRWNDEKLILAFAEFRLACQRHRIDIKKPLEEAARFINEHCTGDAIIQQLSKRRARWLKDATNPIPSPPSITYQSANSSTPVKKGRKSSLLAEPNNLVGALSPATPSSAVKRQPRTASQKTRQKIKQEFEEAPLDSGSEYEESPIKAKNKRVRNRRSSAIDAVVKESDDDDASFGEVTQPITEGTPSKRMKVDTSAVSGGRVEDVFGAPDGGQYTQQYHGLPSQPLTIQSQHPLNSGQIPMSQPQGFDNASIGGYHGQAIQTDAFGSFQYQQTTSKEVQDIVKSQTRLDKQHRAAAKACARSTVSALDWPRLVNTNAQTNFAPRQHRSDSHSPSNAAGVETDPLPVFQHPGEHIGSFSSTTTGTNSAPEHSFMNDPSVALHDPDWSYQAHDDDHDGFHGMAEFTPNRTRLAQDMQNSFAFSDFH